MQFQTKVKYYLQNKVMGYLLGLLPHLIDEYTLGERLGEIENKYGQETSQNMFVLETLFPSTLTTSHFAISILPE